MSSENNITPMAGTCACGKCQYRLLQKPMFVHCCHCTYCQRETGSAFVVNALIETASVELTAGQVSESTLATNSGAGQTIVRCSNCHSALWSYYGAAKEKVAFVRVGTLNDSNLCPPDIHIYTSTKLNWVALEDGKPQVDEFYRRSKYWPEESVLRYKKAREGS